MTARALSDVRAAAVTRDGFVELILQHPQESLRYLRALFERLRSLRKQIADAQNLPPYIVFGDATLREMAQRQPCDADTFGELSGVGSRKLAQYGPAFVAVIRAFRSEQGLAVPESAAMFAREPVVEEGADSETVQATRRLAESGMSVEKILVQRGLSSATVCGHLEVLLASGQIKDASTLLSAERLQAMVQALQVHGGTRLKAAWDALGGAYSYDELRLARGWLRARE